MTMVIFKRTGTAKSIRAKVKSADATLDAKLVFDENGRAEKDLPAGSYGLGCVATGKAGSTYKVEVTSPPASRCAVRDTIPSSGFDFGAEPFQVF